MSAAALLAELQALGVKVWPDAGSLRFRAPVAVLTPALTERMRRAKPELLAILVGAALSDDGEARPDDALLKDTRELDALITRLCDHAGYPEALRREMQATRLRMSPDAVRTELPLLRKLANDAESRGNPIGKPLSQQRDGKSS